MGSDFLLKYPDVYSGLPGHLNRRPSLKPLPALSICQSLQYPSLLFHFDHFILGHKEKEERERDGLIENWLPD